MDNEAYEVPPDAHTPATDTPDTAQNRIQLKINYQDETLYREGAKKSRNRSRGSKEVEKVKTGLSFAQKVRLWITILSSLVLAVIICGVVYKFYVLNEDELKEDSISKSLELQKYGPENGDQELGKNTDIVRIVLSKRIPLFTKLGNTLHISRHGFISLYEDYDKVANLSKHQTILAVYSTEMSRNGNVYYREISHDEEELKEISKVILSNISSTYKPVQGLLVTYVNVTSAIDTSSKHTFQVVLTSDGNKTYAILYYKQLNSSDVVAGYFEYRCNKQIFSHPSQLLSEVSNVGIPGVHVHLLTNHTCMEDESQYTCKRVTCPSYLECRINSEVNSKAYCDCIESCESATSQQFCASDNKTYSSTCQMQQGFCSKYGPTVVLNVTLLYKGECKDILPYGTEHGDRLLNASMATLRLFNPMPLFSSTLQKDLYIYHDGYITTSPNSTKPVDFMNDEEFIAGYVFSSKNQRKKRSTELTDNGSIFYRETKEMNVLKFADDLVKKSINHLINVSNVVLITFVDIPSPISSFLKHTYQLLLLSNNSTTFVIFNYLNLDSNGATTGYYSNQCNYNYIIGKNMSKELINMSNVKMKGKFVFQLNGPVIQCPSHLQCHTDTQKNVYCGCKTCVDEIFDEICGFDGSTYSSKCALERVFCEKFGNKSTINVTELYSGNCSVMYPFGLQYGHKELPHEEQYIVISQPMLLFSSNVTKFRINNADAKIIAYSNNSLNHVGTIQPISYSFISPFSHIYYLESFDNKLLQRASYDVSRFMKKDFAATHILVITFILLPQDTVQKLSFQVVFVSNRISTYAMFNYKHLYSHPFLHQLITEYPLNSCDMKARSFSPGFRALTSTNTDVDGRFVYIISPFNIKCSAHSMCEKAASQDNTTTFRCECKSYCSGSQAAVCATDGITYASACHLGMSHCERFGISNVLNVTIAYNGSCSNITAMYPFGIQIGHMKLSKDDVYLNLSKPMMLFSTPTTRLKVNHTTAGISLQHSGDEIDIATYYYLTDLDEIYYFESFDANILQQVSNDIPNKNNYTATHVVFITFKMVTTLSISVIFQVALISDGETSYVMFNYEQLQHKPFFHSIRSKNQGDRCITKTRGFDPGFNALLSSNVGIAGKFVYNISLCAPHLQCKVHDDQDFQCGCKSQCLHSYHVCGTNGVTYLSLCHLEKAYCEKYGITDQINITVAHNGSCQVLYPFGIENGDKKLELNMTETMLPLMKQMLLFTTFHNLIVISRDGSVRTDLDKGDEDPPNAVIQFVLLDKYNESTGDVYYRETFNSVTLNNVSKDVMSSAKKHFNASHAIIVTFFNLSSQFSKQNHFQIVIGSDGNATYGIFNFGAITMNASVSFHETDCNYKNFPARSFSREVLKLSNHEHMKECPTHLSCSRHNGRSVCSCKYCYLNKIETVCATNNKTYKNKCELESESCLKFGPSYTTHTSVAYTGECSVMYPYGLNIGHHKLELNETDIYLKMPMLLFSKNITRLKINTLTGGSIDCYDNYTTKRMGSIKSETMTEQLSIGNIFYMESFDHHSLQRASYDISKYTKTNFTASQLIIITFEDIMGNDSKYHLQVILVSDGDTSFTMFNYEQTNRTGDRKYVHVLEGGEQNCSYLSRAFLTSHSLFGNTNTDTNGRYVYPVSNIETTCPAHLQCTTYEYGVTHEGYSRGVTCGCKMNCIMSVQHLCGTDKVTYKSLCHLEQNYCNRFGNSSQINVTIAYNGTCDVLYEYGVAVGDSDFVGDDDVKTMKLTRPIPIFSSVVETIYINSNGLLSTIKDSSSSLPIPYNKPIIASYVTDLFSNNDIGVIYFRQTFNNSILKRANEDIRRLNIVDFHATSAVIVTFKDVVVYGDASSIHTFQIVLVSDDKKTFSIFNYKRLDENGATTGFYDGLCNFKTFANSSSSTSLTNTSNVDIMGRHIYQVSKKTVTCPSHLLCQLDTNSRQFCGCFNDCSQYSNDVICGTDHVTYKSQCHLNKIQCETFGNNSKRSIRMAYKGECQVLYPYHSTYGDSRGEGDDEVFGIDLGQEMNVFSQRISTLFVNTNGFVTLKQAPVRLPNNFNEAIIMPYYVDLVSNATKGGLFIRLLKDKNLKYLINADIERKTKSNFNVTAGIIITYGNVFRFDHFEEENSFQLAIVTDSEKTYGIFNYGKLDSSNARVGFHETICNTETFVEPEFSNLLSKSTNIGIIGRHVYLLSQSGDISCPNHLECQKNKNEEVFCGCYKTCSEVPGTIPFCGTDHETYKSLCHLRKTFCEKYGNRNVPNVTKAHDGDCKMRYPFGKMHSDKEIFGDDKSTYVLLSRDMPLFTQMNSYIHINTNGFITVTRDPDYKISIPYNKNILSMYNIDLNAKDNAVYYRETFNSTVLSRADEDIAKLSKNLFSSQYALIITYDNITSYGNITTVQSFQVVLATDFNVTYVILNYFHLDVGNATVGFYDSMCNYQVFTSPSASTSLTQTSNIGIKGRHVYLLTSLKCPRNLECRLDSRNNTEYCGCISDCSAVDTISVCSVEQKEYNSICEFNKISCQLHGAENMTNMQYYHQGKCTGFYPFKSKFGDEKLFGDDVIVELVLKRNIPLFSRLTDRIYISTNGFISMRSLRSSNLTFPVETAVIAGYAMDLDSSKDSSEFIWYRKSTDENILRRVNTDVSRISSDPFAATFAIVVTYEKTGVYDQPSKLLDFQIVVATDGNQTYGIFIYNRLDVDDAVAGYYENDCNYKFLSSKMNSRLLTQTTNTGVKGMHVIRLSNYSCYQSETGVKHVKTSLMLTSKLGIKTFDWKLGQDSPDSDIIGVEHVSGIYFSNTFVSIQTLRHVKYAKVTVVYSRETSTVLHDNFHFQAILRSTLQDSNFQYGLVELLSGLKCILQKFESVLSSRPFIKISFVTKIVNHTHNDMENASLWLSNVTKSDFLVCFSLNKHIVDTKISYAAFASELTGKVTELGQVLFQTTELVICKRIYLKYIYTSAPSVFTSQEGNSMYDGSINTWIKDVHVSHFEVCAKNRDSDKVPRTHNISVHYTVNGIKDECNNLTCALGLQCLKDVQGVPFCGCILNCTDAVKEEVCGSDLVTYASACDLHKTTCQVYGVNNKHNISVAHTGKCIKYPMETGKKKINNNNLSNIICQNIKLNSHHFHPTIDIHILLTIVHDDVQPNNKLFHWIEDVSDTGFTVCIKTTVAIPSFEINWLAFQKGFETYLNGTFGVVDVNVRTSSSTCVSVQELGNRAPHTFVTVQRSVKNLENLFVSVWVDYQTSVELCARDFSATVGSSKIRLNWMTVSSNFLPFLTELGSASFDNTFTEACKTIVYNRKFPSLPDPVVLSAVAPITDGAINDKLDTWLKTSNNTHLTICRKPEYQSIVSLIMLPTLCERDWQYGADKCWKKEETCDNFDGAMQQCSILNSSLAVAKDDAENYLLDQYYTNGSLWIGLNDRDKEGTWVTENNIAYRNWMTGKPDGGMSENCAVLRSSFDSSGWDDVSCSTCNQYVCSKDVAFEKRGGCDHECFNGGTCIIRDFKTTCICSEGFMGSKCDVKVSDVSECNNYTWHNETTRTVETRSLLPSQCDMQVLTKGWHRFGIESKLAKKCPGGYNYCGVVNPGWLYGDFPQSDEGIIERPLHFFSYYCSDDHGKVQIRNCGTFYTYHFIDFPFWSCNYGICIS